MVSSAQQRELGGHFPQGFGPFLPRPTKGPPSQGLDTRKMENEAVFPRPTCFCRETWREAAGGLWYEPVLPTHRPKTGFCLTLCFSLFAGLHCCCPTSSLSGHCCCCPSHRLLKAPPPLEPHQPQHVPHVPEEAPLPRAMCVCGSAHHHQADPLGSQDLGGKSCRAWLPRPPHQALKRGHPHPSTPGLLCGALQFLERMGGTPTLPILDFCPWTMVLQPPMGWLPHTPIQTPCGVMEMGSSLERHLPPCGHCYSGAMGKVSGSGRGW